MHDAMRLRLLVLLLRFAGAVLLLAFPATFLPVDWMAATHSSLGLGELPHTPVFEYLARSIAPLYGFHGVLMLLVSTDPVRYRSIVTFIAVKNVLFGSLILGIDLVAGMPWFWTAVEGPPIATIGALIGWLNRR